jgi:2-(3-amino-3-carboxypropyl)histidine synthase
MKTLFIEAKYTGTINPEKIKTDKLPDKLGLVTSVQFADYLKEIQSYLENKGKKVVIEKARQKYPGQVLGCDQSAAKKIAAEVDAFLYIGDGYFHPIGVKLKTGKDVFTFNPKSNEFKKIEKRDIEKIKMKRKAQLIKFHSSKEIGIIVSTKPGQNRLKEAELLEKKFPEKDFYLILFDNIDYSQLENFNFIECWINTACPRIEEDIKVLNIDEIR